MSADAAVGAGRIPQVTGELVATRRVGAYQQMTIAAAGVAELARPGQFVALAVGGDTSATLLRRCFSIHEVSPGDDGDEALGPGDGAQGPGDAAYGPGDAANGPGDGSCGTVDLVVAAHGPGTQWLTELRVHDRVDVVGPLGRPFPLPDEPVACVLVGGGYGSAPLFWLAAELRARGCRVEMVLGAATEERLFGVAEAHRAADGVTITTDDGSLGTRGWVSDVLPDVLRGTGASLVYGCGPMAMLHSITRVAEAEGARAHVAVEESMACGVGVCMTCVMPVVGDDGQTRMVRSCVEGPIFPGDRVRWDAFESGWGRVPEDAVGAPRTGGH